MHARVNATRWNPDKIEEGLRLTWDTIVPAYQELPGFRGYFLLTEPGGDKAMAITMWETEADMEASAPVAQAMIPKLRDVIQERPVTETYEVTVNVQQ
jgi:heme-degrading monooxygenase HmoA